MRDCTTKEGCDKIDDDNVESVRSVSFEKKYVCCNYRDYCNTAVLFGVRLVVLVALTGSALLLL